jgi:hypothetical protein
MLDRGGASPACELVTQGDALHHVGKKGRVSFGGLPRRKEESCILQKTCIYIIRRKACQLARVYCMSCEYILVTTVYDRGAAAPETPLPYP